MQPKSSSVSDPTPEIAVKDKLTYDLLGQVLQRTFGKQSQVSFPFFVSYKQETDDKVLVRFTTPCSVNLKDDMSLFMKDRREEALKAVKEELTKRLSGQYKEELDKQANKKDFAKSITLKLLPETVIDELEYTQTTMFAHLKKANYKLKVYAELSVTK